jgi:hypothetical protein
MLSKSLPQQMLSKLLPTGEAQVVADLASALEMLVEGLAVHFLRCDDEERAQIPQVVCSIMRASFENVYRDRAGLSASSSASLYALPLIKSSRNFLLRYFRFCHLMTLM